jgi:hypothetical protein
MGLSTGLLYDSRLALENVGKLMRLRGLLMAPLLLASVEASARDIATCAGLYQQLNNAPQTIGNTGDMRRYAQDLGDKTAEIRNLRIEMRRAGCGGGSITVIGGANGEACAEMRQTLQSLDAEREALTAERNSSRQQLTRPSDARVAILAAIRQNSCIPSDLEEQQQAEEKERMKVHGIELPKDASYSGITDLRTTPLKPLQPTTAPLPLQPDRPYDPSRKVRSVGPVFLPENDIDLAHPRSGGLQPQQ